MQLKNIFLFTLIIEKIAHFEFLKANFSAFEKRLRLIINKLQSIRRSKQEFRSNYKFSFKIQSKVSKDQIELHKRHN